MFRWIWIGIPLVLAAGAFADPEPPLPGKDAEPAAVMDALKKNDVTLDQFFGKREGLEWLVANLDKLRAPAAGTTDPLEAQRAAILGALEKLQPKADDAIDLTRRFLECRE